MNGYSYYYFDTTYLLAILGAVFCLISSLWVNSAMREWHGIQNARGLSGAQVAERILADAGLYDVRIECLERGGGDHYDPKSKTVRLSYENYHYNTITAAAVAAHECGHAKQHAEGYLPLSVRSSMVPVVNLASKVGVPMILAGILLSYNQVLIQIGIWAFVAAVVFQLVTLPVEFNASSRAKAAMMSSGILSSSETAQAGKVLRAAAMTYVASAASSVLQLLRLLLLVGGGRSSKNKR